MRPSVFGVRPRPRQASSVPLASGGSRRGGKRSPLTLAGSSRLEEQRSPARPFSGCPAGPDAETAAPVSRATDELARALAARSSRRRIRRPEPRVDTIVPSSWPGSGISCSDPGLRAARSRTPRTWVRRPRRAAANPRLRRRRPATRSSSWCGSPPNAECCPWWNPCRRRLRSTCPVSGGSAKRTCARHAREEPRSREGGPPGMRPLGSRAAGGPQGALLGFCRVCSRRARGVPGTVANMRDAPGVLLGPAAWPAWPANG